MAWQIHKEFGDWQILFHTEKPAKVLEYSKNGYWIGGSCVNDADWEMVIQQKTWATNDVFYDFKCALNYFRDLVNRK